MEDSRRSWRNELIKNVRQAAAVTGPQDSLVNGVSVLRYDTAIKPRRNRWSACVGLILQGSKEIIVGNKAFRFGSMSLIANPFDLPVTSQIISATPSKPFLVLSVKFDPLLMSELILKMDSSKTGIQNKLPVFLSGKADLDMIEAFARLSRLLVKPRAPKNLAAVLIQEIYCHLLNGPEGALLRQIIENGSVTQKMRQAVSEIHSDICAKLDITRLAKSAYMSRSTFFKNFKSATTLSPIQYQKRMRLLEARRFLAEQGDSVESVGFRVGYKSTSQFSREYSRYFGNSPNTDVSKNRV